MESNEGLDYTQDGSEVYDSQEVQNLMSTQETDEFQSHPLYRYVKQIGTVVAQNRVQIHSLGVKLDLIKAELDAMRSGLQQFLEKVNGAQDDSQSLLESQNVFVLDESGKTPEVNPFVSVEWDGHIRSLSVSSSTEYKLKGTDSARTRCRLLLEELHQISELRKMTVSGKKIVKINGKNTTIDGVAVPPLTLQYLYQMEINRRKLDATKPELLKTLKIEVNGYVSKILESFKSGRDEEGIIVKKPKLSSSLNTTLDSEEENDHEARMKL